MIQRSSNGPSPALRLRRRVAQWLDVGYFKDYRTDAVIHAFHSIFHTMTSDHLCLSIGGGPVRNHPCFVNVNIDLFPNVDLVADAHQLPYSNESVDAIYCDAVLEHLKEPALAVQEMYRVLKPGGQVFCITPFMQAYHGYPFHFQNFTVTGHQTIFEQAGFKVQDHGVCVGPFCSLVTLIEIYIHEFCPGRLFKKIVLKAWRSLGLWIRKQDKRINSYPSAHVLASSTYVSAKKV